MMTPKERWLAAITMQPVDRLPFWPKLNTAYPRAQQRPFQDMELSDIQNWIGSDNHIKFTGMVKEVRQRSSLELSKNGKFRTTTYRTASGSTDLVEQFDPGSQAWHPIKFPVQSLAEIELMTAFFEDTRIELDSDELRQTADRVAQIGSEALIGYEIGESALMYWVEWLAGIEMAHYLLLDYPEAVTSLFEAIHQLLVRKVELAVQNSPADVFYMVENTSTTLISPTQYRQYCYPHIQEYGRIASEAGKPMLLHMCGHLKALLTDLATLPVAAFEAFTSPPIGNTKLEDGRTACPDKCLIGGTNATLWLKPAREIIAELEADLEALPHHRGLVITSAGVMPPLCRPETIRTVCNWVKAYRPRL